MKFSLPKKELLLAGLTVLALLLCGLYLTYNTYGNFQFAWMLRGKKVAAFLLVALATGIATVSFQTLTQNQFLTPNILGLHSLICIDPDTIVLFRGWCQRALHKNKPLLS